MTIPTRIVATPAELLSSLADEGRARKAAYGDLAFRGQGNADWFLVPTAFRKQTQLSYKDKGKIGVRASSVEQSQLERDLLIQFLMRADAIGLNLPSSGEQVLVNGLLSRIEDSIDKGTWPPMEILEALAIGQHHGMPTRLLDFSFSERVAALFAAISRDPSGAHLSVWMVDLRFLRVFTKSRIQIVTVPRGPNSYLHAQHGLFLWDSEIKGSWSGGNPPSIEQVLEQVHEANKSNTGLWETEDRALCLPPVVRYDLPSTQTDDLIRELARLNQTIAHLRPGFDAVAESLALLRDLDSPPAAP